MNRTIISDNAGLIIKASGKIYRPGIPRPDWHLESKQLDGILEKMRTNKVFLERVKERNQCDIPQKGNETKLAPGQAKISFNEHAWGWAWVTQENQTEIWFDSAT